MSCFYSKSPIFHHSLQKQAPGLQVSSETFVSSLFPFPLASSRLSPRSIVSKLICLLCYSCCIPALGCQLFSLRGTCWTLISKLNFLTALVCSNTISMRLAFSTLFKRVTCCPFLLSKFILLLTYSTHFLAYVMTY